MQRGYWEDTTPLYSLHSQTVGSWHADLEGHTLPASYKGTPMNPYLFFPSPPPPFLVLNTIGSPSPLRSAIIVMFLWATGFVRFDAGPSTYSDVQHHTSCASVGQLLPQCHVAALFHVLWWDIGFAVSSVRFCHKLHGSTRMA